MQFMGEMGMIMESVDCVLSSLDHTEDGVEILVEDPGEGMALHHDVLNFEFLFQVSCIPHLRLFCIVSLSWGERSSHIALLI